MYRNEIDHGKWKQIYVNLPAFHWETPHFLTNKTASWFWLQKENYRHFEDTINPYSGCVRVIKNGKYKGSFAGILNVTHYTNINKEPEFTDNPEYDIAFYLTGHWTFLFQHFLDNGIPNIVMMLLATGYDPRNVTFVFTEWHTSSIPDILKRWGFTVVKSNEVSAKILVLPEIVPVIHQKFYEVFHDDMNLNHTNSDKIILVSRKSGDTGKNERLILNQDALFDAMKELYGDRAVLFNPSKLSIQESIALFEKAQVVVGSHGGAMYNSMFSSHETKIIEIMPSEPSGLYYQQDSGEKPPSIAHLAMYTNAQLLGQPFYRYYHVSPGSTNMRLNINDVIDFIDGVVKDDGV